MAESSDPRERALKALQALTPEQYQEQIRATTPALDGGPSPEDEDLRQAGWPGRSTVDLDDVLDIDAGAVAPTLDAYLACALTGLDVRDRDLMATLSHSVAMIGRELNYAVYEPRNITDPVHNPDVPDWQVWQTDREKVLTTDLLIHLAHFPSTGSGEELSFAFEAMVPIVVISRSSQNVSRMVTGIPGLVYSLTYDEPEQLTEELKALLLRIRPTLELRRDSLADHTDNTFGARMKALREVRGLTIAELADASSRRIPIPAALLAQWEASTDRETVPTLTQLREVATLLGVSVGELVDPIHDDAILAYLERYVAQQAARGSADSLHDRKVLKRKVLERLMRSLDE